MTWDGPGRAPLVVKQVHPAGAFSTGTHDLSIDGAGVHLDPARATGRVTDGRHEIEWDLTLEGGGAPLFHFPYERLYTARLPRKKLLTPAPTLAFQGTLTVDGERREVASWRGLRGHNWGSEHAFAYAYGNCNTWDCPPGESAPELVIDGFSVKIRLGPVKSPWLSLAVGRRGDRELAWNRLGGWWSRRSRVRFPCWDLELESEGRSLSSRWRADPADLAGLRYFHPDGRVSYCYNTKYAALDVTIRDRDGATLRATSHAAELEFLYPEPLPGLPLAGNLTFPR